MKSLSSNLFKSNWVVVQKDDTRIIDNNELVQKRLQEASWKRKASAVSGEDNPEADFLAGLSAQRLEEGEDFENLEGSENVGKAVSQEEREAIAKEVEDAKAQLEDIRAQSEQLISDAQAKAEAMKQEAYEQAKEEGYQAGYEQGMAQADALKKECAEKEKQLEAQYQQKIEELEPAFIDALTGIYEHIFKVDLSQYKKLVMHLLIRTMQKMEDVRNLMVHVSREDYQRVIAEKERLISETGTGSAHVEIIEDLTLSQAECFIETENGIYDCSLNTQLSELERKLKLLSYEEN